MRRAGLLLAAVLLAGCHHAAPDQVTGPAVDPRDYDAYYLWPGVTPPADAHARLLYLLDGEVRRGGPPRLVRLRMGTPRLGPTPSWLVVRANRLDWTDAIIAGLVGDLARWRRAGNDVIGLQVDFDASASGISGYRRFLARLRARLPAAWRLSITGLMDWSAHGDPRELSALRHIVDEVVIQTYQGTATIPGYATYFREMRGFPIAFRVALVQGGQWTPPPGLTQQPMFKGYIVFLLHHRAHRDTVSRLSSSQPAGR